MLQRVESISIPSPRLAPPPVNSDRLAVFLDLDGVLAPLAPTPWDVMPDPRRTAVLARLTAALDGRLAVVSGRTLSEIDRICDGAVPAASGVHGLERRRMDGSRDDRAADPAVLTALAAFNAFAADRPGVIVEDKGLSAGLHYRQAPEVAPEACALAQTLAAQTGLTLQPGSMVLELKTPGADKGAAVTAFMSEHPFKGARPLMFGDDLTDEFGFRAASALGGAGVLVGPHRETAAIYGLSGVDAVLDWLEQLADSLTAAQPVEVSA